MAAYTPEDHTFVVCAYKDNPYLGDTIVRLLNQSVPSTVIVSTSTPSDYIRGVCESRDVLLVVNPRPHFAGDDWNYGYDQAATPLVTIAHQDDEYDRTFLESVLAGFNRYRARDIQISFTDYRELRPEGTIESNTMLRVKRIMNKPFQVSALNGRKTVKRLVLGFGCPICCPSVTLNKELLGPYPFDVTLRDSCDYLTWVNLSSRPGRFLYIPRALMGHRIYAESATSRNLSENIRTRETLEIMERIWPRPIARLINRVYARSESLNTL